MAEEIKKIISVETDGAVRSLKDYKNELNDIRAKMLALDSASNEYKNLAQTLIERQTRLNNVMSVTKNNAGGLEGSYNSLVRKMKDLQTQWRETADVMERQKLGVEINAINDELKGLDASIGNFQRNVGAYSGAFQEAFKVCLKGVKGLDGPLGDLAGSIMNLLPLIRTVNATAIGGLTGIKAAIASTGIGLLVVAVGQLVSYFMQLKAEADNMKAAEAADPVQKSEDLKNRLKELQEKYQDESLEAVNDYYGYLLQLQQEKNGELVNEDTVHFYKMRLIEASWRRSNQQDVKEYHRLLEEEEERHNKEKERINKKYAKDEKTLLAGAANDILNDQIKQFEKEKKQLEAEKKLKEAQIKANIKNAEEQAAALARLNEEYAQKYSDAWTKAIKAANAAVFSNLHVPLREALDKDSLAELDNRTAEIQADTINAQTNTINTLERNREKYLQERQQATEKANQKWISNHNLAINEIMLNERKQILETNKTIEDEKEKQEQINKITLESIDKQITKWKEYQEKFKGDKEKQIEAENNIVGLLEQQLNIYQQIESSANAATKAEYDRFIANANKAAEQDKFIVDTDPEIEDERQRALAKTQIEMQLLDEKIAMAKQYLENVRGNKELEAQMEMELFNLQQELSNKKRKLEFDNAKYAIQQAKLEAAQRIKEQQAIISATSKFFGSMSELAEEDSALHKGLATMQVGIDTATAVMAAYKGGLQTIPHPIWAGQALGIAQAAAAAAHGAAQLKKIYETTKDNVPDMGVESAGISAVGVNPLLNEQADLERLQNMPIQGDSQYEQRDMRVWVAESDISGVQNRVKVRESDATF